jgi:hypothetical protein
MEAYSREIYKQPNKADNNGGSSNRTWYPLGELPTHVL